MNLSSMPVSWILPRRPPSTVPAAPPTTAPAGPEDERAGDDAERPAPGAALQRAAVAGLVDLDPSALGPVDDRRVDDLDVRVDLVDLLDALEQALRLRALVEHEGRERLLRLFNHHWCNSSRRAATFVIGRSRGKPPPAVGEPRNRSNRRIQPAGARPPQPPTPGDPGWAASPLCGPRWPVTGLRHLPPIGLPARWCGARRSEPRSRGLPLDRESYALGEAPASSGSDDAGVAAGPGARGHAVSFPGPQRALRSGRGAAW